MYKGIVKVYQTAPEPVDGPKPRGLKEAERRITDNMTATPNGLMLEVVVTAKTTESLIKKINAVMDTLDDE